MTYLIKSSVTPITWIIGLLLLGLALLAFRRNNWMTRLGWSCLLLGTLLLLALSTPVVANLLIYSLECRHSGPSPEVLSTLDIVVVLPSNPRCESLRLLNGIRVFKQRNAKKLALPDSFSASDITYTAERPMAVAGQMGIPQTHIIIQGLSGNTMEDAIEIARHVPTQSKSCIGIVTCALHMMRAKWAFEKQFPQGKIVPIPIGHRYELPSFTANAVIPSVEALHNSTRSLHEWIGMAWYSLRYNQASNK